MSSGFKSPITIKDAIDKIHSRYYLLPAIQREFTWSSNQIEMLFDSILRGYPINSFMMWKIVSEDIKNNYKFYEFLKSYREFFNVNNTDIDTKGAPDFEAIIDGQQRLTGLYIGLKGSYAYKMPRKWWKDDEDSIPTRKLYLNLYNPVSEKYDNQNKYDFRFLTKYELEKYKNKTEYFWFEVGKILELNNTQKVMLYINNNGLINNNYAVETLSLLYESIHKKSLINYYLEEDQEADKVLDIFIRTNSGGTPLSFSNLLMSISSANWEINDARKVIDSLVKDIYKIGRPSFMIDNDFVLKTCLFLFIDDIKFQLKNFTPENVKIFDKNWDKIQKCIIAAFTLFEKLSFNNSTFRAKNAAIPIIYYIYYNNLEDSITKATYDNEDKKNISKWLLLSFIKSIFGGQSDNVLMRIRDVMRKNKTNKFPINDLINAFKMDATKNYTLDEDFITGLLESQKDTNDAFYVLHLLYPDIDYYNQGIHQDHMHPATIFIDDNKFYSNIPQEDQAFARDPKNWNSVLNLQFLNEHKNEQKGQTPLIKWAKENNISKNQLYIKENTSIDIKDFKQFINDRKTKLKEYMQNLLL
uniref:GmrSD restriction endonucleases N-terminal domain-containing protein n=1 Tax=uncultured Candidatus Melainabacteria bacterium TaxID=2682970 RepID=A0A650EJ13_9BACT|nr:hypothetical protein Melaina855_0770 [uncultured Candidatus Melainabacteria bacterium]